MNKNRRRFYWILSLVWIGLIYSTLGIVRGISDYLKSIMPLSVVLSGVIIVSLLGIVWFINRRISLTKTRLFFLVLILLGYVYGIATIKYPDEKVHFIQYGVLAVLLLNALKADWKPHWAYGGAFVLCALAGYGDELIQGWLPGRYYDINDIILNAVSGAMGLALAGVGERPIVSAN